ncbi:MAG: RNA methyltransferase, partial [Acidobacteriaceae bacterium]|nr:RNA methyltransferase [Acidobacteriaceae bacterium]
MAMVATVISSRSNAKVKQLRAAFAENHRLSDGLVAIEGEHLLEEAIRSGMKLKMVFVSERRAEPCGLPRNVELLRLTEDVFTSAVETQSPQGVAALMTLPAYQLEDVLATPAPLILIACGVQDPGNLGTLVRSAEAFGASGLLTTPGTVNVWNQKALRASVGSAFRLPVIAATESEVAALKRSGVQLLAATGAAGDGIADAREFDLRS